MRRHDGEQLGAGKLLQVGSQRADALDAHEHQQCGGEGLRTRSAQRAPHQPGHAANHALRDAKVGKHGGEPGNEDDGGQHAKADHGGDGKALHGFEAIGPRHLRRSHHEEIGKVAEEEAGALAARVGDGVEPGAHPREEGNAERSV